LLKVGAKSFIAIPLSIGPAGLQCELNVFSLSAAQELASRMMEIIFIRQRSNLESPFGHMNLRFFSVSKV
jgi:hypothetical protein